MSDSKSDEAYKQYKKKYKSMFSEEEIKEAWNKRIRKKAIKQRKNDRNFLTRRTTKKQLQKSLNNDLQQLESFSGELKKLSGDMDELLEIAKEDIFNRSEDATLEEIGGFIKDFDDILKEAQTVRENSKKLTERCKQYENIAIPKKLENIAESLSKQRKKTGNARRNNEHKSDVFVNTLENLYELEEQRKEYLESKHINAKGKGPIQK